MKYYYFFYGYDACYGEPRDISGGDYEELIDLCFRYCAAFSLVLRPWQVDRAKLPGEPYRKEAFQTVMTRCYFSCTEAAKAYFLTGARALFDWSFAHDEQYPEAPAFYRADGSCFLLARTAPEKRFCAIFPRNGEKIPGCVSKPEWSKMRGDTYNLYLSDAFLAANAALEEAPETQTHGESALDPFITTKKLPWLYGALLFTLPPTMSPEAYAKLLPQYKFQNSRTEDGGFETTVLYRERKDIHSMKLYDLLDALFSDCDFDEIAVLQTQLHGKAFLDISFHHYNDYPALVFAGKNMEILHRLHADISIDAY